MNIWSSIPANVLVLLVVIMYVTGLRLNSHRRAAGCNIDWAPVCGNNSVTYGNKCMMEAK